MGTSILHNLESLGSFTSFANVTSKRVEVWATRSGLTLFPATFRLLSGYFPDTFRLLSGYFGIQLFCHEPATFELLGPRGAPRERHEGPSRPSARERLRALVSAWERLWERSLAPGSARERPGALASARERSRAPSSSAGRRCAAFGVPSTVARAF